MKTYKVNLTKSTIGTDILWTGSIILVKDGFSSREFIARQSRKLAEEDIMQEAEKLDFENTIVIFASTEDRVTSLDSLREELNKYYIN